MSQKMFKQMESVFRQHIPAKRLSALSSHVVEKPMVLIAGDQLTGKSTLGKRLAKRFRGTFWSVGSEFRAIAERHGVTVGELSKRLLEDGETSIDTEIDFRTCEMIGGRDMVGECGVLEGRQPAFMGKFMAENYNKRGLVSVYLKCELRERALRYVLREVGPEAHSIACDHIPHVKGTNSIGEYGEYIRTLPGVPRVEEIADDFVLNQTRDEDDRLRYLQTYGIDYSDLTQYDCVVDTSGESAEENMKKTLNAIWSLKTRENFELPALFQE